MLIFTEKKNILKINFVGARVTAALSSTDFYGSQNLNTKNILDWIVRLLEN